MTLEILGCILLWLLIGDLLSALRPWESEDEQEYALWFRITWPIGAWWVLRLLIRDWRTDLYYRNKHR